MTNINIELHASLDSRLPYRKKLFFRVHWEDRNNFCIRINSPIKENVQWNLSNPIRNQLEIYTSR